MAYTAVPTVSTGELWSASNHNTYVRDNFAVVADQFIIPYYAYNQTGTSIIEPSNELGFQLPDSADSYGYGIFKARKTAPVAYALVSPNATGNVYVQMSYKAGADGEAYDVHSASDSWAAVSVTNGRNEVIAGFTLTAVTEGDYVTIIIYRDSISASDTINSYVWLRGFFVDNS